MLRVTADTNIIVFRPKLSGKPRRLLAVAENGVVRLGVSSEILAAAGADYVISGDKHLLRLKIFAGKPIILVADFLEVLHSQRR